MIRVVVTSVAFAAALAGASCGGGDSGGEGTTTGSNAAAGSSSTSTTPTSMSGSAGSAGQAPTTTTTTKPPTNTTGTTPGMTSTMTMASADGAAGDGAMATDPTMMAAGGDMAPAMATDTGAAGADMGAAGDGGDAAMMPADTSGAFAIRGADPTDESVNGRNMGPYSVESYTNGYMPGDFSDATMWYPTSAEAEPPFGCVAVVPGFVSPQSSIRNWGPFLASNGIVAITIGVPGSDQPQQRAMSLMSALETCMGENTREGSPIKGKLDGDHLGVAGWSMGGGGTLIASADNPQLKAGVSFAAWGPRGGAMNSVPVLMFEATADPLAAGMSDGFYRDTPDSTPKMLFEVQGSSHNVANDPANHEGIIGKYGLSWFKVFLEGDERYRKFLLEPAPSIATSKFETNL